MKKSIFLIIATAGFFSCKQANKLTPETVAIETVNSVRKNEYSDVMGKRVIIQNSLPRGIKYTDPNEKEYSKIMFWT